MNQPPQLKKASKEVDGLEKEVKDTGKTKPELEKVKQGLGGVGKEQKMLKAVSTNQLVVLKAYCQQCYQF